MIDTGPQSVHLPLALPKYLARAGMSQGALARALGLDPSMVQLWAAGKRAVPGYHIPVIAHVLNVSIDDLLDGAGVPAGQVPILNLLPFNPSGPQQRLEMAGLVRLPGMRPPQYELYCLACGRGIGRAGVLITTRRLPTCMPDPCRFCGSRMLLREFPDGPLEPADVGQPMKFQMQGVA